MNTTRDENSDPMENGDYEVARWINSLIHRIENQSRSLKQMFFDGAKMDSSKKLEPAA